ncbi:MAG: thiol-disulfide oxidoreductase DCC family protein [Chitinophagaceae bacterium]
MDQPIVLFDGVCNLCNGAVQFIIRHDKNEKFLFASLQSEIGKRILSSNNLSRDDLKTFLLIEDERVFTKSTAALRVIKQLNGFISILYTFNVIPKFIRDSIYDMVARNRYNWFGKKDECMIPTPQLKARFLS